MESAMVPSFLFEHSYTTTHHIGYTICTIPSPN